MSDFLSTFDQNFSAKLEHRSKFFKKIFKKLEEKKSDFYTIVETGCIRIQNNWGGDGYSTVLFDKFLEYHEGMVYSVDINSEHCQLADYLTSDKVKVVNEDSVSFLWNIKLEKKIDLLYLDSYDLDGDNVHESAFHHFKEFCAAMSHLGEGSIIVVDDCGIKNGGKGKYIKEFMDNIGNEPIINGYQMGWMF